MKFLIEYVPARRYAVQLHIWQQLFPPDKVLVLRSEDMFDDLPSTLQSITDFLQIPSFSDLGSC